jgi:hypothetical protein
MRYELLNVLLKKQFKADTILNDMDFVKWVEKTLTCNSGDRRVCYDLEIEDRERLNLLISLLVSNIGNMSDTDNCKDMIYDSITEYSRGRINRETLYYYVKKAVYRAMGMII